jgi:transcription termination factor Rho
MGHQALKFNEGVSFPAIYMEPKTTGKKAVRRKRTVKPRDPTPTSGDPTAQTTDSGHESRPSAPAEEARQAAGERPSKTQAAPVAMEPSDLGSERSTSFHTSENTLRNQNDAVEHTSTSSGASPYDASQAAPRNRGNAPRGKHGKRGNRKRNERHHQGGGGHGQQKRGRWKKQQHGHHQGHSNANQQPQPQFQQFRPEDEHASSLPVAELYDLSVDEIRGRLKELGFETKATDKLELLKEGLEAHAQKNDFRVVDGVFDPSKAGFGFLRSPSVSYQSRPEDVYIPPQLIKKHNLKPGDHVIGTARLPKERERYHTLLHVDLLWDKPSSKWKDRKNYDELTPLYPEKRIVLEYSKEAIAMRALDLLAPLGRGQRALIVAPPRAGKTVLLQQIAQSLGKNDPDIYTIVLLVDERPEEVGNIRPYIQNGEVIASTFDETPDRHLKVADMVIEKAHRMVEVGRHVVVLMDSLTRYARACNNAANSRGKLMSGGVESGALIKPRKFFSSARNVEEGGSLTIVATVLVETGSRMDDLIFEEFKGTGNAEIYLSRDLQERRIYPAIHNEKTGTRREDLLYHPDELVRIQALRRALTEFPPLEAMEKLIDQLKLTGSNAELLMRLKLV